MATVDQQQHLGLGSSRTPDSLPIGSDFMVWGQEAARYLLPVYPDQTQIHSMMERAGYRHPRVVSIIEELLARIHHEPSTREPRLWRYPGIIENSGMEAQLYGSPKGFVIRTLPHRTTNWEISGFGRPDEKAVTEYSSLYDPEKPPVTPYKSKIVGWDSGKSESDADFLDGFVNASQIDRKSPRLGLRPDNWNFKGYSLAGVLGRWAMLYRASEIKDGNVRAILTHPDGTHTSETYIIIQRGQGKINVAVRAVNVPNRGI